LFSSGGVCCNASVFHLFELAHYKREMIERRKDKRAKCVGERPSRDVALLRDETIVWNFGKEEGWLV
jgi:hypothetical protein